MKRILFVGLIALLVLLAVPMVSALGNDVPVNVVGNMPEKLSLSIDKDVSFASMAIGTQYSTLSTATVDSNVIFSVKADASPSYSYFMTDGAKVLSQPYKLWDGVTLAFYTLQPSGWSSWMTGTTTGIHTQTIQFSQDITSADLAGNYITQVTFTATAA